MEAVIFDFAQEQDSKPKELSFFCKRLNQRMDEKKKNSSEIMRDANIPSSTLCEYTKGTATPLADSKLLRLADSLDETVDSLVYGRGLNVPRDVRKMLELIPEDAKSWEAVRSLLIKITGPKVVSSGN